MIKENYGSNKRYPVTCVCCYHDNPSHHNIGFLIQGQVFTFMRGKKKPQQQTGNFFNLYLILRAELPFLPGWQQICSHKSSTACTDIKGKEGGRRKVGQTLCITTGLETSNKTRFWSGFCHSVFKWSLAMKTDWCWGAKRSTELLFFYCYSCSC